MDEIQMNCFIDCHAHLSANEFDDVSFFEQIFKIMLYKCN
jgi:hypothetical protein